MKKVLWGDCNNTIKKLWKYLTLFSEWISKYIDYFCVSIKVKYKNTCATYIEQVLYKLGGTVYILIV